MFKTAVSVGKLPPPRPRYIHHQQDQQEPKHDQQDLRYCTCRLLLRLQPRRIQQREQQDQQQDQYSFDFPLRHLIFLEPIYRFAGPKRHLFLMIVHAYNITKAGTGHPFFKAKGRTVFRRQSFQDGYAADEVISSFRAVRCSCSDSGPCRRGSACR